MGLPGPSLPSSGSGEASGSLAGMETEPQPSVCVGAGGGWASGWAGPGSGLTRVYWSTVPAILASPLAPPDTQKPHLGGRWRQAETARGTQTSGHARCPRWCYDSLAGPMVLKTLGLSCVLCSGTDLLLQASVSPMHPERAGQLISKPFPALR